MGERVYASFRSLVSLLFSASLFGIALLSLFLNSIASHFSYYLVVFVVLMLLVHLLIKLARRRERRILENDNLLHAIDAEPSCEGEFFQGGQQIIVEEDKADENEYQVHHSNVKNAKFVLEKESRKALVMSPKSYQVEAQNLFSSDESNGDSLVHTSEVKFGSEGIIFQVEQQRTNEDNYQVHQCIVKNVESDLSEKENENELVMSPNSNKDGARNVFSSDASNDENEEEDDEEGDEGDYLIEIPLPKDEVNLNKERKQEMKTALLEWLPESLLQEEGLEELLFNMNGNSGEDNNLIEIDINMGSIQCSNFLD